MENTHRADSGLEDQRRDWNVGRLGRIKPRFSLAAHLATFNPKRLLDGLMAGKTDSKWSPGQEDVSP